jgi:hypothetical protein
MAPFWRVQPVLLFGVAGLLSLSLVSFPVAHEAEKEPQFCTQEYAPVCGMRKGDRQTFSNACHAAVAGYRVIHEGECRG